MTQPTEIPVDQVEQVPPPEPAPEDGDDLSAFEVAVAAVVLRALTKWLAKVARAVNRDVETYATAPDSDEVLFLASDWTKEVDRKIIPELRKVQRRGWGRVAPARRGFPDANAIMLDELARARNLLVRIPDEVYALVNAELMVSAAAGDDVYHQARRVDEVLNATSSENWPNRSKVIAVTEVNRAYAASILAGGFQAQVDENRPLLKRWDASNDSRVREWHRAADGQTVPLATAFDVGPDKLQYPGDPDGLPHNVIHCVLGNAEIAADGVTAAYRSQWNGPVLSLEGEDGVVRTVTPNHPVLALEGWLPACEVEEGDYLLGAVDGRETGLRPANPYVQDDPTTADQVFGAFAKSGITHRVEDLSVNFHGDIPDGQIDVVLPVRELVFDADPMRFQIAPELQFILANGPVASLSPFFKPRGSVLDPPDGPMGFENLMFALLRAHALPPQSVRLRTVPRRNLHVPKATQERWSTDTGSSRYAFERLARQVAPTKIVKIHKNTFAGHVYSFETTSGIYIADKLITHNCRCTLDIVDGDEIRGR